MGKLIQLFDKKREGSPVSSSEQEQISLPFNPRPKLSVVIAGHLRGPDEFGRLVDALDVSVILDMRAAPRLDVIAPTRLQAFNYFESHSIQYRDVLGRVGATSYAGLDMGAVVSEIRSAVNPGESSSSGTLLLFESPVFLELCLNELGGQFELDRLDSMRVDFLSSQERLRM